MENTETASSSLFVAERRYRNTFYLILQHCLEPKAISEINAIACKSPELRVGMHSPEILVEWLAAEALLTELPVDLGADSGEDSTGDDPAIGTPDRRWKTSPAGERLLEAEKPLYRLQSKLREVPDLEPAYRALIEFCLEPKQRTEIEQWAQNGAEVAATLSSQHVQVPYLLSELESVGGLEFGGFWKTTESGREVVEGTL